MQSDYRFFGQRTHFELFLLCSASVLKYKVQKERWYYFVLGKQCRRLYCGKITNYYRECSKSVVALQYYKPMYPGTCGGSWPLLRSIATSPYSRYNCTVVPVGLSPLSPLTGEQGGS